MKATWDEPKWLANIYKHGFDFGGIDGDFFLSATIRPAKGNRLMAIGKLDGMSLTAIFARLGHEGLSIISMRHARRTERSLLNDQEN